MGAMLNIVLAEDNADHAEMILATLDELGADLQVLHVRDGESLLHYLRGEPPYAAAPPRPPDVVMLDIKMPRMNGKEALREIRSDPALRAIPVIVITTSSSDDEIRECFALGASSYVTKPLEGETLAARLAALKLGVSRRREPSSTRTKG